MNGERSDASIAIALEARVVMSAEGLSGPDPGGMSSSQPRDM